MRRSHAQILTDEARDWALRVRRHAGLLGDCFRRLASMDGDPLRENREAMLVFQVNPPNAHGHRKVSGVFGAAVSRLKPVIRA